MVHEGGTLGHVVYTDASKEAVPSARSMRTTTAQWLNPGGKERHPRMSKQLRNNCTHNVPHGRSLPGIESLQAGLFHPFLHSGADLYDGLHQARVLGAQVVQGMDPILAPMQQLPRIPTETEDK